MWQSAATSISSWPLSAEECVSTTKALSSKIRTARSWMFSSSTTFTRRSPLSPESSPARPAARAAAKYSSAVAAAPESARLRGRSGSGARRAGSSARRSIPGGGGKPRLFSALPSPSSRAGLLFFLGCSRLRSLLSARSSPQRPTVGVLTACRCSGWRVLKP